ncbi:MAG TPA: thiamine-phosphate kinase [Candidatus Rubrimentiphilum sp.]|nr:thiamine-phosphate kinase [Candidatus Rubrimentiphilum sp.]
MSALNQLREDRLVEAIAELVAQPSQRRVLLGIGDDAAVWQPSRSHRSVITTDATIEDVHFRRDKTAPENIGRRAMGAALSDIAAMGARPVLATISIGLRTEDLEVALPLYRGIAEVAQKYDCAIAGGDVSRAPAIAIVMTIVGEVRPSHIKTRAGAQPRDVIAVTGVLGGERAAGYAKLPEPRMREGRWLGANAAVHAMMDLSDGLSVDLARMCARSGCAALIERIPASRGVSDADALAGGEEYELLIAVARRAFPHLAGRFAKGFGRELERVGFFRDGEGVFLKTETGEAPVAPAGWDHFSAG